jgi:peptidoglycan/xylan/chitin deacetylase (PgdA/CDA1 family)
MSPKLAVRTAAVALLAGAIGLTVPPTPGGPQQAAQSAPASISVVPAAATYSISRCGMRSGRVLLTFDDWAYGDPYRATRIGAYLRSRNIRAAFFLIKEFASEHPGIVTTLRRQGHWVLNHTWDHRDLTRLSDSSVNREITHGIRSNRLRPPGGAYSPRIVRLASALGYRLCMWTIDSRDWQDVHGIRRSASSIRDRIRTASWSAKHNGVILGHLFTNYPEAVPGIIRDLHAQGLLFCRNRGPVGRSMPFPPTCT